MKEMDDNSRKDDKNKKESVVTTCSNFTTIIRKPEKFVTSVHIFGRKISLRVPKQLWTDFKKLAKREGKSASKVLERAVVEYVKTHSHGNPQLLMSNYIDVDEPSPMRVLCPYCQGALSSGEVFCQRKSMWIKAVQCYSCKHNRLRKHE